MTAGIYLITNKINGHMYVGGSVNIRRRLREHKSCQDLEYSPVDRAIKKYGKENFTYQIITELPNDWKVIDEHEKYWIKFYNAFEDKNHYNLTEGGGGRSGFKHSEESKKKMKDNHADVSGENNPRWKNYARIVKTGFNRGKQQYAIRFNGKNIKFSINIDSLKEWFNSNYPNEELIINESIKSE
jgi:group I intron endonuclease